MSGQNLIDEMRSGARPAPKPAGGLRLVDLLIALVAVVAVGSLGFVGIRAWFGSPAPQGPAPVQVAVLSPAPAPAQVAWSDADTNRCKARARAESEHPVIPDGAMPPDRAAAEGVAGLATLIECKLVTKPMRFCAPEQKTALVAMIQDYLTRMDIVVAALGVQGAPMKVMGGLFGGEMAAGDGIYQMERDSTVAVMRGYDAKVTAALRKLARDGIVAPADFAGFMGGVPENIKRMFGDVTATQDVCA